MEWLSFQRAVWIFARWVETQIYGASKFILCIGGTTSNSFLPRFFSEAKFAACTIKYTFKWEVGRSSNVWWKIHPLQVIHSYFKVLLTIKYQAQKSTQIYKFTTMQDLNHWDICVFWVIPVENISPLIPRPRIYGSRRDPDNRWGWGQAEQWEQCTGHQISYIPTHPRTPDITIVGAAEARSGWEMGSF